jgi:MFS family permease
MALVVSFRILGLSLLIPVIAVHGLTLTDSTILIGIVVGGYGATQAIFQIPYGLASDVFGRKRMIVIGMLIFSAGSLLGGFSHSIESLIAARILQGGGAVTATVFAFITDTIDVKHRNFVTAMIGAPIGIFFGIGVIVGPILAHAYGINLLFFLSGVLGLIITLYVILFIQEGPIPEHRRVISRSQFGSVFKNPDLRKINGAGFLMYSTINAIFYILPLMLMDRYGLAMKKFTYIYIPMILVAFVLMLSFSRIADRGFTRESILFGFGLIVAGSVGMLFGMDIWIFAASAILVFAGANIMEPILPIFVGKVSQPQVVGTAMGAYSTIHFFGSFIGAVMVGFLLPYGYIPAILFLTVIGLTGFLLGITMKNPDANL